MGGSHGGYIGAWIASNKTADCSDTNISKENLFSAFVLLNPVTDLVLSLNTSDIPDWSLNESGIEFENDFSLVTYKKSNSFDELWKRSPIRVAHLINRPVLVIIGNEDKRVSPLNGIRFSQASSKCKLVAYPDNGHALDSVLAQYTNARLILSFFTNQPV